MCPKGPQFSPHSMGVPAHGGYSIKHVLAHHSPSSMREEKRTLPNPPSLFYFLLHLSLSLALPLPPPLQALSTISTCRTEILTPAPMNQEALPLVRRPMATWVHSLCYKCHKQTNMACFQCQNVLINKFARVSVSVITICHVICLPWWPGLSKFRLFYCNLNC